MRFQLAARISRVYVHGVTFCDPQHMQQSGRNGGAEIVKHTHGVSTPASADSAPAASGMVRDADVSGVRMCCPIQPGPVEPFSETENGWF